MVNILAKKNTLTSLMNFFVLFHTKRKWTDTLIATCPPEASLNTVFICVGRPDLSVVKQRVRCLPITSVG